MQRWLFENVPIIYIKQGEMILTSSENSLSRGGERVGNVVVGLFFVFFSFYSVIKGKAGSI